MKRTARQAESLDERSTLVLVPRGADLGRAWKAIVIRRERDELTIVAERETASDDAGLPEWLATWRPARALALLPAGTTIARLCPLPPAEGEQLVSALRLQAETALLGGMPRHRVAMAVLPAHSASPRSRQGVVLAWPESRGTPTLPPLPPAIDLRFVPAMASLFGLVGGRVPASPLLRTDRRDGSIQLLCGDAAREGFVLRSTREDPADADEWRNGIRRSLAETLSAEGRDAAEIDALQRGLDAALARDGEREQVLVLPAEVESALLARAPGVRTGDPAIDDQRMLAIGAMLAASGPLAGLVSMRQREERQEAPMAQRIVEWISEPRRLAGVLTIAALLFLTAPLAAAGVRWAILSAKLPDADQYQRLNRVMQQKVALYRQLADSAWPVTKLLGDLANAMPEGIEIETLQVATGDGVTIRGLAKAADRRNPDGSTEKLTSSDVLLLFERNLRQSGVFSNVDYKWDPEDGRGWRGFTLTCQVPKPTQVVAWKEDDDFAVRDLRTRRHPNWREIEGARPSAAAGTADVPAVAAADAPPPPAPRVPPIADRAASDVAARPVDDAAREGAGEVAALPSDRGIGRRRAAAGEDAPPVGDAAGAATPAQPGRPANVDIPGPFTDEEIRALSRGEAQALLARIGKARQTAGLDAETQERLKQDFQRVLNQAKNAS